MALKNPLLQKVASFAASLVTRVVRKTLDCRAVYFDPTADPVHPDYHGRKVFAVWHEYMMTPIMLRAQRSNLALASEHGDGEMITRAMQHLGWSMARGSTTRGGTAALLRMLRDDNRNLVITPDGPKGPRRTMSPGPIFLAAKLGLPLICVGFGLERPWRARSWDRFAIPRPFSRCRVVFGPPVLIPGRLDRAGLELYRVWCEKLLNWLSDEADAWIECRRKMVGDMPMLVGRAPWAMHRKDYRSNLVLPETLAHEWANLPGANPIEREVLPLKRAA